MKLKHVAAGVFVIVLAGQCGTDADVPTAEVGSGQGSVVVESSVEPREEASARPPRKRRNEPKPSEPSGSPRPAAKAEPGDRTALAALGLLAVKGRAPMTGYDRARFGSAWLDADRNGCDTRNDILAAHVGEAVLEGNGCVVATGVYADPYTATSIDYWQGHGALIDIDHVVAMGNAWATGAFGWHIKKRAAFANDPLNLLPADAGANRQKGDGDAATWLPPNKAFRCRYVARQVAVKRKYDLWVTAPEKAAIARVLASCPAQPATPDTWGAPTVVDHDITDPGDPGQPSPSSTSKPVPFTNGSVHFANCDAARAAGAAPVHAGDPGYGRHLDRDGDGVGCE